MRAFKTLSAAALAGCWSEILEESSLLQINHLKGDIDSDCFREGRCGPGSTTTPRPLQPAGICTVAGDPHIKTFDSDKVNVNYYYNGDFHLVKSKFVNVQARYFSSAKSGKSSLKALAVGGDIMEGGVLMIEPRNGLIRLDGVEVKLAESGSVAIGSGTLSSDGDKKKPVLTLSFPQDDVTIKIKRLGLNLNAIIEMRPEPGQDGHCGNFNGDVKDDDLKSIRSRMMATPLRYPETMFPLSAATLLGCSQASFGEKVGVHLNTKECNMMCSQRGTQFMANKDEACYCADGSAPGALASCQAACEDPAAADPGFCIYAMAKPAAVDINMPCALNEKKVAAACAAAMKTPTDVESCQTDVCASGDLSGTLSIMKDWDATEKKERLKMETKKKKEKGMSEEDRKKRSEKLQKRRLKKAANTKERNEKERAKKKTRMLKKDAKDKAMKEQERAKKEKRNKDTLKNTVDRNKQAAAKEQEKSQALAEAKKAKAVRAKAEQAKKEASKKATRDKKVAAAKDEAAKKKKRVQAQKAAAIAKKKAERANKEQRKKDQAAAIEKKKRERAEKKAQQVKP